MKQIIITGTATGQVSIDAQGFADGSCKDATAKLKAALGSADPSKDKEVLKPEASIPCASATQGAGLRV